ncbi:DUF1033 family protein [Streptococcus suis]|nr:DUF1033 family protein [Streptococcus suis]
MYQVIKMYGDFEPWWFIEGWEEDITDKLVFENYEDAVLAFQKEWTDLASRFPMEESKGGMMTAFWDEADQYWCEECDEYLQRYHSLLLLEAKEDSKKKDIVPRVRPCKLKKGNCVNY